MVFGGPAATVGFETVRYYPGDEFHSHSDVYDDLGQTREWHFNDTRLNATDEEPGGLVFLGTHAVTAWRGTRSSPRETRRSGGGSTRAR